MNSRINLKLTRTVAIFLAVMIILSMMPSVIISAFAATEEHPDYVTITVTDSSNAPVEGAQVEYRIDSSSNGEGAYSGTVNTDEKGCAEILSKDNFVSSDLTVTASVTKSGYATATIENKAIESADQNIEIGLSAEGNYPDITVESNSFEYDGKEHPVAVVSGVLDTDDAVYTVNGTDYNELIKVKEVDSYEVTVTVNRDGFDTFTKTVTTEVSKGKFEISVTPLSDTTYDGKEHPAAEVGGLKKGDVVTYTLNDVEEDPYTVTNPSHSGVPSITNAGEYTLKIKVERENYEDFEKQYTATITVAELDGITVSVYDSVYDGAYHKAVEVKGAKDDDEVVFKVPGDEWAYGSPQIRDYQLGGYDVSVMITRSDDNYKPLVINVTAYIRQAGQSIAFKNYKSAETTAVYYDDENEENNKYDFSVSESSGIVYSLTDPTKPTETSPDVSDIAAIDSSGLVTVKGPGCVTVVAKKSGSANYKSAEVKHNLVIGAEDDGLIMFTHDSVNYTLGETDGKVSENKLVKAYPPQEDGKGDQGEVEYSITGVDGMTVNKTTGEVSVSDYKAVAAALNASENGSVTATVTADKGVGKETITIDSATEDGKKEDEYAVYFSNVNKWSNVYIHYWGGSSSTSWPGEKLDQYTTNHLGEGIYRAFIPNDTTGIVFSNGGSSAQTLDITNVYDNANYYTTVESQGKYGVDSVTWTLGTSTEEKEVYPAATASYTVVIKYDEIPANPYTIASTYDTSASSNVKGKIDGNDTGWFISSVEVTPNENYTICMKQHEGASIEDNVSENGKASFGDNGVYNRTVYLKNKTTGGVSAPVDVLFDGEDLKIDTVAPQELAVRYSEPLPSQIGKVLSLGFYNPSVTMSFSAVDETSDIYSVNWKYSRENDASASNLETKEGNVLFADGKADQTLTGTEAEQYRGHISFVVYDAAGNASVKFEDDKVFAIDTISPALRVGYSTPDNQDEKDNWYYGSKSGGNAEVRLIVDEINFYEANVKVNLIRDGGEPKQANVSWSHPDSNTDVYFGDFTIGDNGESEGVYQIDVRYTDNGENKAVPGKDFYLDTEEEVSHHDDEYTKDGSYRSMPIVIDSTAPVIHFGYTNESAEKQYTTVTIDDVNFDPADISITKNESKANICYYNDNTAVEGVSADTLTQLYRTGEWTAENTFTYAGYTEGIYDYVIHYTDLAGNEAEPVAADEYMIDHTAPDNFTISYTEENYVIETIMDILTFRYYHHEQPVTVTFTATDKVSGVEQFNWFYDRYSDASETNKQHLEGSVPDVEKGYAIEKDGSKFTAKITLSAENAGQLMGQISVNAVDTLQNQSDKYSDSATGIVVDTVSPKVNVTFDSCSNIVDGRRYYGLDKDGRAGFTVSVDEANFFEKDLQVSLSKNGGAAEPIELSWTQNGDLHYGTYIIGGSDNVTTHKDDGNYVVSLSYSDHSENIMKLFEDEKLKEPAKDSSGNQLTAYKSNTITIDTIKPVVEVTYDNHDVMETLADRDDNDRDYFDSTQKATIKITERNFNAGEVDFSKIIGEYVDGTDMDIDDLTERSSWSSSGDVHIITITFYGDSNYTFDLSYADLAKNEAEDYEPDYFTVDTEAPVVTGVSYSQSVLDTVIGNISFGFYNAPVEVTVTADDDIAGVHEFNYNYRLAEGVSSVNAELLDQAVSEGGISYSNGGETATLVFDIPKDGLGSNNQFNGTVDFTAMDRSHNEVKQEEDKRLVVDNISPTISVSYNSPVNSSGGVNYYDGNINGTITINEANFYSEDVTATYTMNGGSSGTLPVSWSDSSVDVHIGTFTLSSDGDYIVSISYTDKSGNAGQSYTSGQMTIDTKIENPTYSINGTPKTEEGGAYKEDALVGFNYSDQNFDSRTLTLTRTRFMDKDVDVTEKFVKETQDAKGGFGSFDIPKEVENDGIYTLTITMKDKALHTATSFVKFTINRFGSVYEYSDYLISLIKDGGQYVKIEDGETAAVTDDLIITEYNADKIVKDSLNILITRDGEPVNVKYRSDPAISDDVEIGDSGWYQYLYTIDKSNFEQDGVYKISLSSKDATQNESISVPENSINAKGDAVLDSMKFTVDTTNPEILNIANLDKKIINAQQVNVKYSLVDIGGLSSVEVYVNEVPVDVITDFSSNLNDYSGEFVIDEKNEEQSVRLVVKDIAGNITDTMSDSFDPGEKFVFFDRVTISTNFFVRWFANKPLFFGTIAGAVVVLAGAGVLIGLKVKKKKKAN